MSTIDNYIKTCYPFYDSVDHQNFKKEWMYDDLCSVKLICSKNRLLPFQVQRRTVCNIITQLDLYSYDGTYMRSVLSDIDAADFIIKSTTVNDRIIYYGAKDLIQDLPCGCYYLVMSDNRQTWYGEVFSVQDFVYGKSTYVKNGSLVVQKTGYIKISDYTPDINLGLFIEKELNI